MDLLARIGTWLSDHEAMISAVVGITVLAGVLFAGLRSLVRRRAEPSQEKALAVSPETQAATDSSPADLDPLTVPGFEGRPAIAVLPFDDLSREHDQEYFADGIAEDLITRLSTWRDFPVIARNSSFVYKGKPVNVKQVSRELGVRYVVEGSVRKAGDRVRITAQLVDAVTGGHVWAEIYDRELRDIFTVQDEITEAIVASMRPELLRSEGERAVRKEPQNLDAWDCYARGQWHLWRMTKEDNERARSFFEKATDLDPTFALAFAHLAGTHAFDLAYGWTDSHAQSSNELSRLARTSLELDEREPLAHIEVALAFGFAGQQREMIASLERATELSPNIANSVGQLGFNLSYTGRPDEAIAYLKRAMRLSPKDSSMFVWLTGMGLAHFAKQRYEEAASWLEQSRKSRLDFQLAHRGLAATYAQLGRLEEARKALQEYLRLAPGETVSRVKSQVPYTEPDFMERYIDGLRKAGMKE